MGDVSPSPHQLLVEAVIFWSIGVVIFIGRMYALHLLIEKPALTLHSVARCISNGGIRNLQGEYLDVFRKSMHAANKLQWMTIS